jgi:outer membrane receptor protein involved in Fe transport
MGTDFSYQANALDVKSTTAEFYTSYQLSSKHALHAGVQFESNDIYNLYMQYAYGGYVFEDLAQFLQIAAPGTGVNDGTVNYRSYTYNALNPDVNPAAEFTENKLGVFVRDVWRIAPNFQVDMGLRLDTAVIGDDVPFNQKFYDTFGVRNDSTYDGKTIAQPRFGFNWQPKINDGKLRTVVRGGFGLFYGGSPVCGSPTAMPIMA